MACSLVGVAFVGFLGLLMSACGGSGDSPDGQGTGVSGPGTGTGSGGATASGGAVAGSGGAAVADGGAPDLGDTLSAKYPGSQGLADDPAVLFYEDFEQGWGRWDAPSEDTKYLHLENDAATARAGAAYLRSTVTSADLEVDEYISASPRVLFDERVDEVWWRFYARFPNVAANPHHWVRLSAGTESWESSGLANTVPPGDGGFWFDFDASNQDEFNFYVYWHQMRSGRCNDGSATPGCEGDQGNTYHYGNVFRPPSQTPFPRDEWFCIEIHAKANEVGTNSGELSFAINDALVGDYRPGTPSGTWLRDSFHTGGCEFSACTPPMPFEGFDFRASADVKFKGLFLDAYYERNSAANKKAALEEQGLTVSDEHTILYDDIVVATSRIGCGE